MSFNVVLFDLDGTLVDSVPLIGKAYRNVFREMEPSVKTRDVGRC